MQPGNVALILHAHHPYVRAAGRSYAGEESLHALIASSLIPTLGALHDLHEQGATPRVGLAWSPMLLEQLADPVVQKHFSFWLDDWLARLDQTGALLSHEHESARAYLIRYYREWGQGIRHSFDQRFGRNLVGALRVLCEAGVVEPIFSTATDVPCGQISRVGTLRAQIELGALAVTRWCGGQPQGFWPPAQDYSPNTAALLVDAGATYVVGNLDGIDGTEARATGIDARATGGWLLENRLAALRYDQGLAPYLDDPALAYSGDPLYRSPATGADGLAWFRNGLAAPNEPYDPFDALLRAHEHAEHFADVLAARTNSAALELVVLDTALLGADWFEGPTWLQALVRMLAARSDLALTLPADWLRANRPKRMVDQAANRRHPTGEQRSSLRRTLHSAENRLAALARRLPDAESERERVLQQAARELLLAQAGTTPHEITKHLARCDQLCAIAEHPTLSDTDLTTLETWEEEDNPFAYLNYRMFA
ncbi:MAG: DUF1957 domain-containing protein [Roseiflexaceae bacterium]|nr:DUF1957 domain-containing protein [Roseiflexaceae bacterium]